MMHTRVCTNNYADIIQDFYTKCNTTSYIKILIINELRDVKHGAYRFSIFWKLSA